MNRVLGGMAVAASVSAFAGCGHRIDLAPVSGVVTLDGRPLAGVHISFQPVQSDVGAIGMGSYGVTSSDGRYQLRLVEPSVPGAVPGRHRVRIRMAAAADSPEDAPTPEGRIPARYRDGTLMIEVPAAGNLSTDFTLRTNPG